MIRHMFWVKNLFPMAFAVFCFSVRNAPAVVSGPGDLPDGIQFTIDSGTLRVQIRSDSVAHVTYAAAAELFIRPGCIIPMGPLLQYSSKKPADPIELRVYPGSNGTFTLYQDEGDSYRYEKGAYATIPLAWDDSTKTLTISPPKGEFLGMLNDDTFNIVLVKEQHV